MSERKDLYVHPRTSSTYFCDCFQSLHQERKCLIVSANWEIEFQSGVTRSRLDVNQGMTWRELTPVAREWNISFESSSKTIAVNESRLTHSCGSSEPRFILRETVSRSRRPGDLLHKIWHICELSTITRVKFYLFICYLLFIELLFLSYVLPVSVARYLIICQLPFATQSRFPAHSCTSRNHTGSQDPSFLHRFQNRGSYTLCAAPRTSRT